MKEEGNYRLDPKKSLLSTGFQWDHNYISSFIFKSFLHFSDDKEIEAVVNCLADTLKDGCHPGAPEIIPRCKNDNKIPTVFVNSNNCLSKNQKLLFKPNLEDNGPIEPSTL